MDIYARLEADHDTQRSLFKKAAETEGDTEERRELWRKIKIELEAHASAEEQTFYAELMSRPDGSDKSRHSVAEHKEAADLIEEIDDTSMSSPSWLQRLKHLQERVEHHVDEEEDEVFPLAKKLIASDRAEALVGEFNKRKPAEVEKIK